MSFRCRVLAPLLVPLLLFLVPLRLQFVERFVLQLAQPGLLVLDLFLGLRGSLRGFLGSLLGRLGRSLGRRRLLFGLPLGLLGRRFGVPECLLVGLCPLSGNLGGAVCMDGDRPVRLV